MKLKKYIISTAMAAAVAVMLPSCAGDKFSDSIFPTEGTELDPNSYTYQFDKWLELNYLNVYNLDFRYKMQDVGADMNYNLVPATLDQAEQIAVLTRYLWFDVYKDIVGPEFLKMYGPRIIHLIGSPAYNANSGTEILGLAEGGLKVSLFKINELQVTEEAPGVVKPSCFNMLNEYYFKTMHHEFGHILHQTKSYPTSFNLISQGHYDAANWNTKNEGICMSKGFTSNYASSEYREDYAETIANYIVRTDEQWDLTYWCAEKGWYQYGDEMESTAYAYYYYANEQAQLDDNKTYCCEFYTNNGAVYFEDSKHFQYVILDRKSDEFDEYLGGIDVNPKYRPLNKCKAYNTVEEVEAYLESLRAKYVLYPVEDTDGIDGVKALQQKINIVRNWFKEEFSNNGKFNASIDDLRDEVQKRQSSFDINELMKEIHEIPIPNKQ